MEGPYKLLPAEPAKSPNRACLAGRSLYCPSMSYVLGFQTKYIWNPWGIPVHPAQLLLLYLSTLFDSWLAHCVVCMCMYVVRMKLSLILLMSFFLIKRLFDFWIDFHLFIKWYSNSFTQALCVEENWFMSKFSLNQLQLLFILEKLLLHHNVRNILNTYIQLLKFLSKDCNAKISYFCLFFNVSDPACLGSKPSRHPRVSDKILFTQQNSKTRCGFYTYRNIRDRP